MSIGYLGPISNKHVKSMLENTHKNADAFNIESQDEGESIGLVCRSMYIRLDIQDCLLSPALPPIFLFNGFQ